MNRVQLPMEVDDEKARFAEKSPLAAKRVLFDERAHILPAHSASASDARNLKLRRRSRNVRIRPGTSARHKVRRNGRARILRLQGLNARADAIK
jgi:hypothetical protein